jgi:rare lipoprotein A
VEVVINDRGPHIKDRDISITRRAARELGILRAGTGQMEMEVLP